MTAIRRVLVVDDEPMVRRGVAQTIRRLPKVEVREAGTNREVLQAIAHNSVDAIVMDFLRPGGTALDLMNSIASYVRHRNVVVMLLTGSVESFRSHGATLLQLGVRQLLLKPIDAASLLTEVGTLLDGAPFDGRLVLLLQGTEDANTDYKATLDLSDRTAVAKLAKDVIAMANTLGGGHIFFGVHQVRGAFEYRGVPEADWPLFDPTRVNDALRRHIGPLSVQAGLLHHGSLTYGYIAVRETPERVALPVAQHERADLYLGRIYHRTEAARSEEIRDAVQLEALLDRCIRARSNRGLG